MMDTELLELAKSLISKPSITPNDAGCQELIAQRLSKLGFRLKHLTFGDVDNLWAIHGNSEPVLVFAGHTDVVPPGPLEEWSTPPFEPTIRDNHLYGRGTADMKSSIAAMLIACEKFITQYPEHPGSIGFLITSDEEGTAINGTQKVVEYLIEQGQKITWCLVGEASSTHQLGDNIKNGRRGSLNGLLTIYGKQGHIAYPLLADNPIHKGLAPLHELTQTVWDQGNAYFPPTSLQISNIKAGAGASNVIPNQLEISFNFRYAPTVTAEQLQQHVKTILDKYHLQYSLEWQHSGKPFLTEEGTLTKTVQQVISETLAVEAKLSTDGGTSDGRFIAKMGCEVIELGPRNQTIHKINECIAVQDLINLEKIYYGLLLKLLS